MTERIRAVAKLIVRFSTRALSTELIIPRRGVCSVARGALLIGLDIHQYLAGDDFGVSKIEIMQTRDRKSVV